MLDDYSLVPPVVVQCMNATPRHSKGYLDAIPGSSRMPPPTAMSLDCIRSPPLTSYRSFETSPRRHFEAEPPDRYHLDDISGQFRFNSSGDYGLFRNLNCYWQSRSERWSIKAALLFFHARQAGSLPALLERDLQAGHDMGARDGSIWDRDNYA